MVKEMRLDLNPLPHYRNNHNHVILKFVVSFVLLGLAFRFLVSDSVGFSSVVETQGTQTPLEESNTESPETSLPAQQPDSADYHPNNETQLSNNSKIISLFFLFSLAILNVGVAMDLFG